MDRKPNACQHSALLRGACVGRFAKIRVLPRPALRALGVALALALLATGCTTGPGEWIRNGFKVGPNYCRPRAPVADQWIDTEDPHVQAQAADYGHWWGVFDDPVLNELVEAAYEQNLPLKIAGMRILEARAQLGRATGDLFPQRQEMFGVFARNELSHNSYPFGQFPLPKWEYDFWSLGLGNSLSPVSWELDFWGRFRRGIESAEANMNAQIESYDDALVILQAEVAATYIQVRTLEERLALARQNVELQKNTLRITQDRFDQGVVSELDVQQARSVLGATESLIPVLQMGRRKAQNRLCTLMGMPPRDLEAELGGPGATPTTPPEVAVGIPAELLRRRPDVRRAEREAAAQCARIGIAESELYPHFSISGYIAFDAENFADVFDWDSIAGHVGPSFRWNILNYGRILNDVRVQEARFSQAVLNYQETVLRANEEAENAITFYLREQARVKSLDQSTAATARAVELANIQYEQGLIDFQRVLDSQRALVLQQDTLAESRGNVALNLIGLYKALGGGWEMRLEPNLALASVPAETPFEEEPLPAELAPMPPPLPAPGDGTAEAP